jgi:hypothetical protein
MSWLPQFHFSIVPRRSARARRTREGCSAGAFAAVLLCLFAQMANPTTFNAANFVTILGAGQEMAPSVTITTSKVPVACAHASSNEKMPVSN